MNSSLYGTPDHGLQPAASSRPVCGSTTPSTTPAGMGQGAGCGRPEYRRSMSRAQTGAARRPPVALAMTGRTRSNPIHTPAAMSGV